jgi:ArsR family transcriptional regulator
MYQQIFELHAELLKALAHPKRLEIIQLLRNQKLTVTQIQTMLDLPQCNVSQHLQILREANVVSTSKKGKQVTYQIAHKNFIKACDQIREILIEQNKDTKLADELTLKMTDLVPLTTDPVCGMRVSPKTAAFAHKHNNHSYYFCASGCLKEFTSNINKYLK